MTFVIYAVAALFAVMAFALLFAYGRTHHSGLFILGLTYGGAAVLALMKMHWWPLVAGFALAWVFRLLGLDPGASKSER